MIQPVVIDLFWNEKLNGGRFENVFQVVDETQYYWNCYSCGKSFKATIGKLLKGMKSVSTCQLNYRNPSCTGNYRNYTDKDVLNLIKEDEELYNFVSKVFSEKHRELEVITRCPICGELHSVKLRSINRSGSFICKKCQVRYGGRTFDVHKTVDQYAPGIEEYWSSKNKFDYRHSHPLCYRHPFYVICPECGKESYKSLEAIMNTGAVCETCARLNSRLDNVGSLMDNYPVLGKMWDEGGNSKPASRVLPNADIIGRFACRGRDGDKPLHYFSSVVYSVVNGYKGKGLIGCPVCVNRELYTGVNDFATQFPELVQYWDYEENESIPDKTICNNYTSYALICPTCGKTSIKQLDMIRSGGAYCSRCSAYNKRIQKGSSLRDWYPEIADMYDKSGRNTIPSDKIPHGSSEKCYFYCDGSRRGLKPHIFRKSLSAEIQAVKNNHKGNGCPICQGTVLAEGVNDFKTMNPEIAAQWDYELNDCAPEDVYFESEEKYHFVCKHGHKFVGDPKHLMRSKGTSSLGCPVCHGKEVIPGVNDIYTLFPKKMEEWLWNTNIEEPYNLDPRQVSQYSNRLGVFRCRNCGKLYETTVSNWINDAVVSCEDCRSRNWSYTEKEIAETIESWGIKIETQHPICGRKYLLDIYVPDKKIAIEYNGLYWHSDAVRTDTYYHYNKYTACRREGISLYCIWEDDYKRNKGIVLRMLKRKLGVSTEARVNARDCEVYSEDYSDVKDFMNANHIQGAATGSFYITLRDKKTDVLRSVGVFKWVSKQNQEELSLVRYCTSGIVRGGFSKMISVVLSTYYPESITTFSDNAVSDGNLYKVNGFKPVKKLDPDYSYVVGNVRKHKFEYRLARFKKDPDLLYEEGMSESQLAKLNNLPRCWDYGKVKWKFSNTI